MQFDSNTFRGWSFPNIQSMKIYTEHTQPYHRVIDLDFWKNPEGVTVPDDDLSFLLIPDAVEAVACLELARAVHEYQLNYCKSSKQITKALMITMGGLLPGVLLYDHLIQGQIDNISKIQFGTIGISLYKGPMDCHKAPIVQNKISIPIKGDTVLMIDDLGDGGRTMQFASSHLLKSGARKVLNLALYMKPKAMMLCGADFYFGQVPQNTWIITPRERIETLVKCVSYWKKRGAPINECHHRLVDLIGYSPVEVDYYLEKTYYR